MLSHAVEPNVPRRIIRGLKVPCTWARPSRQPKQTSSPAPLPSAPGFGPDTALKDVRLRRDGLVTARARDAFLELVLAPDTAQEMESHPGNGTYPSDSLLGLLDKADKQYYGIPSPDPGVLFSAPLSIQWDLTSRCNLHCKHCYSSSSAGPQPELPGARLFSIVEESAAMGVHALHFLGGEPFVREELADVVQRACRLGMMCHVSSNGTLITEEHAGKLAGLQGLTVDVSLDSAQASKHDWLRGQQGAYERAIAGMQRLRARGIQTSTTCTIYPDTLDEMEDVVQQAIDLGAQRLQFLRVSPVGRAHQYQEQLVLPEADTQVFADRFRELAEKYAGDILIDSPVVPVEPETPNETSLDPSGLWLTGCLAGIDKMAIRADGSVVACPQLQHIYGNIETTSIRDAWNSLHAERLSRLGQGCAVCAFDGFCGGGCPAPHGYDNELAPCLGRGREETREQPAVAKANAAWCPTDCPFPCSCPTHCAFPCSCPTDCRCPVPCSCPTHCAFPCSCPTDCRCPVPCSCPTHCRCPVPCSCPTHCLCPVPCSCPTHCLCPVPCLCPTDCRCPVPCFCPMDCCFPCTYPRP